MPTAAISRIEYEPVMGHMPVTFTYGDAGLVAIYFDVPVDTYIRLKFAAEPERYFREKVMGRYSCMVS